MTFYTSARTLPATNVLVLGKDDTDETWEWLIKDHEERTVPISENTTKHLIALQEKCPPGYLYVFIPQSVIMDGMHKFTVLD